MYFTWPVAFSSISSTHIYVIRPPRSVGIGKNDARSLEYRPQPTAVFFINITKFFPKEPE